MLAKLALYLLLAADARGIAVVSAGAPDEGCPSARQVTDALGAKLPGVAAPPGSPAGPNQVRLAVSADANGVRVDISDSGGNPLLRRSLPPPPRTRPSDCVVLADTVALIVERYWREVGYDVPASPPPAPAPPPPPAAAPPPSVPKPPPPKSAPPAPPEPTVTRRAPERVDVAPHPTRLVAWSLGGAVAGRTNPAGGLDPTLQLALAGERHLGEVPFGLRLTGGVGAQTTAPIPGGTADVRRFPLRVGLYLPITTPVGRIEPGAGAGVDLFTIAAASTLGPPDWPSSLCSQTLCVSPGADLALGWSLLWDQHVYLRAFARGGVAAPFGFVTETNMNMTRWSSPRTYFEVALESGVWFP